MREKSENKPKIATTTGFGNVGFIYKKKCHPVTQAFADTIHATPHRITNPLNAITTALKIPNYNYYFIESVMSMITPITKRLLGKKCIIVFRGNDELFANTPAYLGSKNPLKRAILKHFIKYMDAVSVESQKQVSEVQQHTPVPVEVAESFIGNKGKLEKIKPNMNTNTFLFVGAYRPPYDHKNIRLLISIFNETEMQEYKLMIIGKGTEELKEEAGKNIEILGFVEDKDEYYKKATYYIHLPRYEAGPITIIEAGTAGLITITSGTAGHYNLVEDINKSLSLPKELILAKDLDKKEIIERIKAITNLNQTEKEKLSETFKKNTALHFSKEEMCKKFKETWNKLIEQVKKKQLKG
jgi:hypothetical protein